MARIRNDKGTKLRAKPSKPPIEANADAKTVRTSRLDQGKSVKTRSDTKNDKIATSDAIELVTELQESDVRYYAFLHSASLLRPWDRAIA